MPRLCLNHSFEAFRACSSSAVNGSSSTGASVREQEIGSSIMNSRKTDSSDNLRICQACFFRLTIPKSGLPPHSTASQTRSRTAQSKAVRHAFALREALQEPRADNKPSDYFAAFSASSRNSGLRIAANVNDFPPARDTASAEPQPSLLLAAGRMHPAAPGR